MDQVAVNLAIQFRDRLQARGERVVLAESCTAGRVAATLGCLPGISQWLCGSFVVYRCDSKSRWLDIPAELLSDPKIGPVSDRVTELLAQAALAQTPEAAIGLAVTGEIGPGAPAQRDGILYCALARRQSAAIEHRMLRLAGPAPQDSLDLVARNNRLDEATRAVLTQANGWIANY